MIELQGVSRTVPSGDTMLTILHPLDLVVESSRVAAITGPSGSGKSTLLGLLAGLDAPSTGRILIDGADITAMSEDALARFRGRRIGFVFQFFHLLPSLTAIENVRVPLEIAGAVDAGRRADALLAEVGLAPRRHHYPSQLSGGEQQRVAIARALANDPPILLADEPTGNLDSATGHQVIDLLIDVNRRRGTTVVLDTRRRTGAARRRHDRAARWTDRRRHGSARRGLVMRFVLLMAAREIRASWRRLLFFFVCVAIGVGAIVALRSMIQNVRTDLAGEARALIAGDVAIATNRPWTDDLRAAIDRRLSAAPVEARQDAVEVATMVRPEEGRGAATAKMVELRGVQAGFPLYGRVVLQDGSTFTHDRLGNRGVLVRPELLAQLGLAVGDRLMVGGTPFTIRGVISQEPGRRAGAFSFGSRVLIDLDDLRSTGLLTFGSRARYEILLKVSESAVQPLTRDLRQRFGNRFVTVRSFRSTEDQIGDDLVRAENYLSLVGFVILVLGGIGVWSVTRVFVRQKIRSVAILKCVGATTRQVLSAYVLQVVLLGLAGSALGIVLARAGLAAIPASVAATLGTARTTLTASAIWQGVSVGMLVSLLFSLVPLLEMRRVKPLLLLRGGAASGLAPQAVLPPWWTMAGTRTRLAAVDWLQVAVAGGVSAALVAIASWQAASLRVGLVVCIGFAAVAFVLHLSSTAIVYAVRPLARARAFPLRHAVLSLGRPGNQTRVILLAVGLGSFFVIGVRALQANLLEQFSLELSSSGADMFLIEILPDQVDQVRAFLEARKAPASAPPRLIPVLRARVTGVRGRETTLESFDDVRRQGALAREYVITYRDRLESNEKVIDGAFWTGQPPLDERASPVEVSVERSIHQRFRINVGDIVRFDVLGRRL